MYPILQNIDIQATLTMDGTEKSIIVPAYKRLYLNPSSDIELRGSVGATNKITLAAAGAPHIFPPSAGQTVTVKATSGTVEVAFI